MDSFIARIAPLVSILSDSFEPMRNLESLSITSIDKQH